MARRSIRNSMELCMARTVFIIWLILPAVVYCQEWNFNQVDSGYKTAVVFIESHVTDASGKKDVIRGTGFLVNKSGFVISVSHVVPVDSDAQKREFTQGKLASRYSYNYQWVPLDVINRLVGQDLVLLKFKGNQTWPNFVPIPRAEKIKVSVGTIVYGMGFPQNEDITTKEGKIDNLNATDGYWMTSLPITRL